MTQVSIWHIDKTICLTDEIRLYGIIGKIIPLDCNALKLRASTE